MKIIYAWNETDLDLVLSLSECTIFIQFIHGKRTFLLNATRQLPGWPPILYSSMWRVKRGAGNSALLDDLVKTPGYQNWPKWWRMTCTALPPTTPAPGPMVRDRQCIVIMGGLPLRLGLHPHTTPRSPWRRALRRAPASPRSTST